MELLSRVGILQWQPHFFKRSVLNLSLGFRVIHTYSTEVNVKLHSKDVTFYFFLVENILVGLNS